MTVVLRYAQDAASGDETEFEDALKLARAMTGTELRRVRVVSLVEGEVTGHSTLPIISSDLLLVTAGGVVADASAFQPLYRSDRGLGAKMSASEKIANSLIRNLTDEVALLHLEVSGDPDGFEIVHVPMPGAFRIRGSFGTHWKMPEAVELTPVLQNGGKAGEIEVDREALKDIIAAIFSDENGAYFKDKTWDEDEEKSVQMLIAASSKLWIRLKTGLE